MSQPSTEEIYIYATTYAFSRYNTSLMSMRFILIGIGAGLLLSLLKRGMDTMAAGSRSIAA